MRRFRTLAGPPATNQNSPTQRDSPTIWSDVTLWPEPMPTVNPEILVWARKTAGLTLEGAATKVGIRDAYGMAAVDRLAALERGENEPTRPILVKMAQHYRRPLLAFYLAEPPPQGARGADFRRLSVPRRVETEALIDALVRNVRSRQGMVRSVLETEGRGCASPICGEPFAVEFPQRCEGGFALGAQSRT